MPSCWFQVKLALACTSDNSMLYMHKVHAQNKMSNVDEIYMYQIELIRYTL